MVSECCMAGKPPRRDDKSLGGAASKLIGDDGDQQHAKAPSLRGQGWGRPIGTVNGEKPMRSAGLDGFAVLLDVLGGFF